MNLHDRATRAADLASLIPDGFAYESVTFYGDKDGVRIMLRPPYRDDAWKADNAIGVMVDLWGPPEVQPDAPGWRLVWQPEPGANVVLWGQIDRWLDAAPVTTPTFKGPKIEAVA